MPPATLLQQFCRDQDNRLTSGGEKSWNTGGDEAGGHRILQCLDPRAVRDDARNH
jgi:hypothetical protein